MGLTIHWTLKLKSDNYTDARNAILKLNQAARDLPFKTVHDPVEFSGDACDFGKSSEDDPFRWMKIKARESVIIWKKPDGNGGTVSHEGDVLPKHIIGFSAWPGGGCESVELVLASYPRQAVFTSGDGEGSNRRVIRTKLDGWRGHGFCKTQYASDPNCGGVPNFLQCHLAVIALLDQVKKLGLEIEVNDEGGFWESRDIKALMREVGEMNQMIAGLLGSLDSLAGAHGAGVEAPIRHYPNFEHLEAAGEKKLPGPLRALLARVLAK